ELWEEAHKKRASRALHEGEAAFEHSCRLLKEQSNLNIQAKIARMAEEAATAQRSALEILRQVEEKATIQELLRVNADLESQRKDGEAEVKRHLHREAAEAVNIAVEGCTSKHKLAQEKATNRAAEDLRKALDVASKDEVARTKLVLRREARLLNERSSSFIPAVEEALSACSLRQVAEAETSRLQLSSPRRSFWTALRTEREKKTDNRDGGRRGEGGRLDPLPSRRNGANDGDVGRGVMASTEGRAECTRVARALRLAECTATAAEREYAKRARKLVRLRAAIKVETRHTVASSTSSRTGACVGGVGEHNDAIDASYQVGRRAEAAVGERSTERACSEEGAGHGYVLGCGGCAVLFEANERLLDEARACGFLG
ncbi:unnamed protein product, partial [Hapterophycus canaliculatus]